MTTKIFIHPTVASGFVNLSQRFNHPSDVHLDFETMHLHLIFVEAQSSDRDVAQAGSQYEFEKVKGLKYHAGRSTIEEASLAGIHAQSLNRLRRRAKVHLFSQFFAMEAIGDYGGWSPKPWSNLSSASIEHPNIDNDAAIRVVYYSQESERFLAVDTAYYFTIHRHVPIISFSMRNSLIGAGEAQLARTISDLLIAEVGTFLRNLGVTPAKPRTLREHRDEQSGYETILCLNRIFGNTISKDTKRAIVNDSVATGGLFPRKSK